MTLLIEQVLRVVAAAIVGAAIGYEREIKNKPAGFFTFTLVSVGSCLIAILQQNVVNEALAMAERYAQTDPLESAPLPPTRAGSSPRSLAGSVSSAPARSFITDSRLKG